MRRLSSRTMSIIRPCTNGTAAPPATDQLRQTHDRFSNGNVFCVYKSCRPEMRSTLKTRDIPYCYCNDYYLPLLYRTAIRNPRAQPVTIRYCKILYKNKNNFKLNSFNSLSLSTGNLFIHLRHLIRACVRRRPICIFFV